MSVNSVNIVFKEDLLRQIDQAAREESRSRSELILEATRFYLERKKNWSSIFAFNSHHFQDEQITDDDIAAEIQNYRIGKTTRTGT